MEENTTVTCSSSALSCATQLYHTIFPNVKKTIYLRLTCCIPLQTFFTALFLTCIKYVHKW